MKIFLRKTFLKILKKTKFDFYLNHHLTGFRFFINSYTHKGYWYYGKEREKNTISEFLRIINKGDLVLEIGGHIGYFSTYFAYLVGESGSVHVFEPSPDNLNYLRKNVKLLPIQLNSIVNVINKGVGSIKETIDFYIDPITGQNNSFLKDFEGFNENKKFQADESAQTEVIKVDVIRLDDYVFEKGILPNFIKIDVEGFEWEVLKGFKDSIFKFKPILMVEIQNHEVEIFNFFNENGYLVFNDKREHLYDLDIFLEKSTPNIFFIPEK
jgi:FkbM family methyltransferase